MPLHLDNLRDSVEAIDDLLRASEDEARMGQLRAIERIGIRAGAVKHFEITYELSWKLAARWLNTNIGAEIAAGISRRQLFRLAAAHKLISDVDRWMRHHEARNTTSHMYDPKKTERATPDTGMDRTNGWQGLYQPTASSSLRKEDEDELFRVWT